MKKEGITEREKNLIRFLYLSLHCFKITHMTKNRIIKAIIPFFVQSERIGRVLPPAAKGIFCAELGNVRKGLLTGILAGIMTIMYCPAQNNVNNPWNVADDDTIWLKKLNKMSVAYPITGAIFKSIDPRFIANKHGFTKTETLSSDYPSEGKAPDKFKRKEFSLFTYDSVFPYDSDEGFITSVREKWDYYINDNPPMVAEARAIVSVLMPQAIESVVFTQFNFKDSPAQIRFNTRDISKNAINEGKTVYLLNDDQVITQKLFEVINPVFIRSLKRITNHAELEEYGYEDVTEIVKINLFKREEVVNEEIVRTGCSKCDVYLVDGIPIDWKTLMLLNKFCFKEISVITEDEKKDFAPYRKLFPKKLEFKSWKKQVTIVSLYSLQNNVNNPWNIADDDTVWLTNVNKVSIAYPITGVIFKSIDPRFIANKHGITKIEKLNYDYPNDGKTYNKIVGKEFSLFTYDNVFPYDSDEGFITSVREKWDYYINDTGISTGAARAIISVLMPQDIERLDFIKANLDSLPASVAAYKSKGSIRFYTKGISKSTINEGKTVYLLNDGDQVITQKLFEAINPVFIRSLKRITDHAELKEYGYEDVTEIVKINLFKHEDVVNEKILLTDCVECYVYLVDNIPIDRQTLMLLNKFCFKEISVITEDEKEAFAPYQQLFSEKLAFKGGGKIITVISL